MPGDRGRISLAHHLQHAGPILPLFVGDACSIVARCALSELRRGPVAGVLLQHRLRQTDGQLEVCILEGPEGLLVQESTGASPLLRTDGGRPTMARAGITLDDLQDYNRLLLALDLHQVQLAAEELVIDGQRGVGRSRADHVHAIVSAEPLEAAGEVHGVAQAAELHLHVAAEVARQRGPCVHAAADPQHWEPHPAELLVQEANGPLLLQRRGEGLADVVRLELRSVPEDKEAVSQNLGDDTIVVLHDASHEVEVAREDEEHVLVRQVLAQRGEVADVREHRCHLPPVDMQARSFLVAAHNVQHHRLRHESRERLDRPGELVEGPLQLPNVADATRLAISQLLELWRAMREVQVVEPFHEGAESPQRRHQVLVQGEPQHNAQHADHHEHDDAGHASVQKQLLVHFLDLVLRAVDVPRILRCIRRERAEGERRHDEPRSILVHLDGQGRDLKAVAGGVVLMREVLSRTALQHRRLLKELGALVRHGEAAVEVRMVPRAVEVLTQGNGRSSHDALSGVVREGQRAIQGVHGVRGANHYAFLSREAP
mmetsp:Transcript_12605/g.32383  ORF Transcript_12605/g.32383 Transcript_12605/m.32383 type:complete len:544 (+) Transcript_12605:166-1797(+)